MITVDIVTVAPLDILFQKGISKMYHRGMKPEGNRTKCSVGGTEKHPTVVERDKLWEGNMQSLWVLVFNL